MTNTTHFIGIVLTDDGELKIKMLDPAWSQKDCRNQDRYGWQPARRERVEDA